MYFTSPYEKIVLYRITNIRAQKQILMFVCDPPNITNMKKSRTLQIVNTLEEEVVAVLVWLFAPDAIDLL